MEIPTLAPCDWCGKPATWLHADFVLCDRRHNRDTEPSED